MIVNWFIKSESFFNKINNIDSSVILKGGKVYELMMYKLLKNKYKFKLFREFDSLSSSKLLFIKNFFSSRNKKINEGISIIDPYLLALNMPLPKTKNIAIIHHIDFEKFNKTVKGKFFLKNLLNNIKQLDKVITVSKYWEEYLVIRNINNVETIYNSFYLEKYKLKKHDKIYKKFNLSKSKPIIYLGSSSKQKGSDLAFKFIEKDRYQLVSTGNNYYNLPINNYKLSDEEFIELLSIADLALGLSEFKEGWNRTIHEAMLLKKPVIGFNSGGMGELLESGNQYIIKDIGSINNLIEKALNNSQEKINDGYDFASKFDQNYFEKEWIRVFNSLK